MRNGRARAKVRRDTTRGRGNKRRTHILPRDRTDTSVIVLVIQLEGQRFVGESDSVKVCVARLGRAEGEMNRQQEGGGEEQAVDEGDAFLENGEDHALEEDGDLVRAQGEQFKIGVGRIHRLSPSPTFGLFVVGRMTEHPVQVGKVVVTVRHDPHQLPNEPMSNVAVRVHIGVGHRGKAGVGVRPAEVKVPTLR